MRDALLIIAHGSRDPENISEFWALMDQLRPASALPVEAAFLDYLEPGIPAGIEACRKRGATRIKAFPCFLFEGQHVLSDIPAIIKKVGALDPGTPIDLLPSLGTMPALRDLFASRIAEEEARLNAPENDRAIVFVAGGSKNPSANEALVLEAGRYRATRKDSVHIGHAFLDSDTPTLGEAFDDCLNKGKHHVIIQPYFLFSGTLVKRLHALAREGLSERPGLRYSIARPLGPDRRLVEMILAAVKNGAADSQ